MTAPALAEPQAPAPATTQDAPTLLGQQATDGKAPATDAKTAPDDAGKPADTGKPTEQKPVGAPEKYEFKAEAGQAFDDKVIAAYSDVARELNLPQDAAQKILDKVAPVMQARLGEQFLESRDRQFAEWKSQAEADKEFGGANLKASLTAAAKVIDKFGGDELRTMLNQTGLGNHPAMLRVFAKVGKAISDDGFVSGERKPSNNGPMTMADLVREADRAAGLSKE